MSKTIGKQDLEKESLTGKGLKDIDGEALDALIVRITDAKEHNLALSPEDCQLILDALVTLAFLQENLASNKVTIHKLRKLAGIIKSSENLSAAVGEQVTNGGDEQATNDEDEDGNDKKKVKLRTKQNKPNLPEVKPQVEFHPLDTLNRGDDCPECA